MVSCRYKTVIFLRISLLSVLLLQAASAALTPKQKADNVASFEMVWSTVLDRHPDSKFNGLDWRKVHDETLPKILAATSMDQVRATLMEMLGKLGTSHYGIVPGEVYDDIDGKSPQPDSPKPASFGNPGIETLVIDGKAVVSRVVAGSPAEKAGIKAGMTVDDVNGAAMDPMLRSIAKLNDPEAELIMQRSVARKIAGPVDEQVALRLRDAEGHVVETKLEREPPKGELVTFGNLPPMRVFFESRRLEGGAGYIHFNLFINPITVIPSFEKAMHEFAKAPGVILDLRGNPGGIGFMANGLSGYFIAEEGRKLGEMRTRDMNLNFVIFPRAEVYSGPVAVLIDGGSASTSEIFAAGLQDLKRARVFGTRSAGAALPSDFRRLPNGDGFQFAMATYKSESGRILEGRGVVPDVEVRQTPEALAAGRDLVIEAAQKWIAEQAKR